MKQGVFVHSWFRCSSTYFWSKLRQNPGTIAFYEPLHERLKVLTPQDILGGHDPNGVRMLRHPEAERHYFAEYLELVQQGDLNYYSELAYDRYFLQPHEKDDTLKRYISNLIEHAQKRGLTAALCFCRSPMRSAWMKENFGGLHIALVRNPLDQWESFKLGDYFVSRVVLTFHNLKRQHSFNSSQLGIWPFREYSMQLISPNPNVQPSQREIEDQLFRMFFVIWLASLNQSAAVSELILDFDRLSDDEEWRIHISDRLKEFGLQNSKAGISRQPYGRSDENHQFRYCRIERVQTFIFDAAPSHTEHQAVVSHVWSITRVRDLIDLLIATLLTGNN